MQRIITIIYFFTLVLISSTVSALPPVVDGIVFDDRNANGFRDKSESGIAGVAVSDGNAITRTDAKGYWKLYPSQASVVFVIKPDAWQMPVGSSGLPDFWIDIHSEKASRGIQFVLQRKSKVNGQLDLLIFGDPQPKNTRDVGYYKKDIIEPLIGNTRALLGISLGDIVHGKLALYPAMSKVTQRLNTPWLHVSGNHDRDYGAESDEQSLETFSKIYGPDTFAWEEAGVSIIALDDVVHEPNSGAPARYVGGLRDS